MQTMSARRAAQTSSELTDLGFDASHDAHSRWAFPLSIAAAYHFEDRAMCKVSPLRAAYARWCRRQPSPSLRA